MRVEIDGIQYVPESQARIKLGNFIFEDPERLLWEIYSWYTHQVWESAKDGNEDEMKKYVEGCDMFEQAIKDLFGMRVPENEYKFVKEL